MQLRDRVAVVTGAASGIGLALAEAFAAAGMRVVLADIEHERLAAACAGLVAGGAAAVAVPTDVSDPAQLEALREAALTAFGGAHLVCNNAGVAVGGPVAQVALEAWQWAFGVNFWGVVHGVRSFVPHFLEQGEGHVVNTASAAGLVAAPFMGPYCATKHAVVAISQSLAFELAGTGVGVSVVCPSWVRTRIHDSQRNAPASVRELGEEPLAPGLREFVTGLISSGLAPEAVAAQVVEAVERGRFWVFPHDEVRQAARRVGEAISQGELPSFTGLT